MDKLLILEALTKIGAEGPVAEGDGICYNLARLAHQHNDAVHSYLKPYFARWPESLGVVFPIDGAGNEYGMPGMWSLDTENGRKRYRLLAWLIHEITKEIRNEYQG
jgi:hypothetical protein